MALSVSTISPTIGRTGGSYLVTITGVDYALPAIPNVNGIAPPAPPSVRVTFGSAVSPMVYVLTSSLLKAVAPVSDPGAVAVTVQNLSPLGVVLETVVVASPAFTFRLPDLTVTAANSALVHVTTSVIQSLKRQVLSNVSLATHTDFDGSPADGLDIVELAELPAIVLTGPRLRTNRLYARQERPIVPIGDGSVESRIHQIGATRDVVFNLLVASNSVKELNALIAEVEVFFSRNIFLIANGLAYEMWRPFSDDFVTTSRAGKDNLRQASTSFVIRGITLDDPQSEMQPVYVVQSDPGLSTVNL